MNPISGATEKHLVRKAATSGTTTIDEDDDDEGAEDEEDEHDDEQDDEDCKVLDRWMICCSGSKLGSWGKSRERDECRRG